MSASLARIFLAFAIAVGLGIPIGLVMGLSRWAKGVFDAPIEFYWPLPPLAYLPLMIIWLGIGEASKITLLSLAMFAPIALSAQAGVRSVTQERVNAALSLGATRWQLLREVILPSALPEILTGARISLGVGWGTLVAAELIAATRGIGYLIMSASQFLATDVVFVGIAIIAACAFAFSLRCVRWSASLCHGRARAEVLPRAKEAETSTSSPDLSVNWRGPGFTAGARPASRRITTRAQSMLEFVVLTAQRIEQASLLKLARMKQN